MPEDRRILCTAHAHVTGWRAEGHGHTADGALEVDLLALAATLPSVSDPHAAVELMTAAHRVCSYSNATRGNLDVLLTANGHSVEDAAESQAT